MAAEEDIVRISYKQLESLAHKFTAKDAQDTSTFSPKGVAASSKKSEKEEREKQRRKRPDRQIYQPGRGIGRLNQRKPVGDDGSKDEDAEQSDGLDNADDSQNSDRGSCEREMQRTPQGLLEDQESAGSQRVKENKRRSKRPDIQIYVPRPKQQHEQSQVNSEETVDDTVESEMLEVPSAQHSQNNVYREEELSAVDKHFENTDFPSSGRKVDVHSAEWSGMTVTVLNEDLRAREASMRDDPATVKPSVEDRPVNTRPQPGDANSPRRPQSGDPHPARRGGSRQGGPHRHNNNHDSGSKGLHTKNQDREFNRGQLGRHQGDHGDGSGGPNVGPHDRGKQHKDEDDREKHAGHHDRDEHGNSKGQHIRHSDRGGQRDHGSGSHGSGGQSGRHGERAKQHVQHTDHGRGQGGPWARHDQGRSQRIRTFSGSSEYSYDSDHSSVENELEWDYQGHLDYSHFDYEEGALWEDDLTPPSDGDGAEDAKVKYTASRNEEVTKQHRGGRLKGQVDVENQTRRQHNDQHSNQTAARSQEGRRSPRVARQKQGQANVDKQGRDHGEKMAGKNSDGGGKHVGRDGNRERHQGREREHGEKATGKDGNHNSRFAQRTESQELTGDGEDQKDGRRKRQRNVKQKERKKRQDQSNEPESNDRGMEEKKNKREGDQHKRHGRKKESHSETEDFVENHDRKVQEKKENRLNLKVTFAANERHVNFAPTGETPGDQPNNYYDMSEKAGREDLYFYNRREGSRREEASSGKVHIGGLIKLPKTEPMSIPSPQHSPVPQKGPKQRSRPRGRGGTHRMLYDPNNPNKNAHSPKQMLHFHDPYEQQHSPEILNYNLEYCHDYGPAGHYYDMAYKDYQVSPHPEGIYYPGYPIPYSETGAYTDDTYSRDPYYHAGCEPDMVGGRSRSEQRATAEALLREVTPLDTQLGNILSRRIHGEEGIQKIVSLRKEVQNKYEQIILLDPDYANRHNVEQILWKSAFYQVIEVFRKHLHDDTEENTKESLNRLLDEGTIFYENLLKNLQSTYSFTLEDFLDCNTLPPEDLSRHVKLALLSAQRSMICLGDIARYKEQTNQKSNYGKARSWYMKAQQIAPKNGRPYNQLAILALYTRRKLDAVYYYMRSLAASNPFLTARESLMSLFDEARKKAEVTEKKRSTEQRRWKQACKRHQGEGHRVEIWISPDGTSCEDEVNDNEEEELSKLSAVELNKRFVLSFLIVHGKLFTKIGMETFEEVSSQMLSEFRALLQHIPSPIGNVRLLQLMAVNMFSVDNTALKDSQVQENCRSLQQEQAIQLGLDMFGLLVERCVQLFEEHVQTNDWQIMGEDLHQLFPSVKVWCDWMTCHSHLWNPPPSQRDPELGPDIDVWQSMADLCNVLKLVDISHVKLYPQKKESCEPIILQEDTMLAGFVPLLSSPQIPMYVHSTVDKEIARDCLRVEKLRVFGDYLCGIEPPLLTYNVETHKYVSIAPETQEKEGWKHSMDRQYSQGEDDVVVESEEEEEACSSDNEQHIRHLREKKAELVRRKAEQERQERDLQALLDNHNLNRIIELEIRPLFLVPDTNCFIDHLPGIEKLLAGKKFIIIVPLVVINELDGLAKGSRESHIDDSGEQVEAVSVHAARAVQFLEDEFEARNTYLRAMTSKGTKLDTIAFRSEETDKQGNNDDLILSCCLYYCKDKARDFMHKNRPDDPITLQREVVLLTDDRNLRLKAHTRNVPAKDIPAFLTWSKVG